MSVLLFVMFVSCQGFLLDGNTQATTKEPKLYKKVVDTNIFVVKF